MMYDENFRYTEKTQKAHEIIKKDIEPLFNICVETYGLTPEETVALVTNEISWQQTLYRANQNMDKRYEEIKERR